MNRSILATIFAIAFPAVTSALTLHVPQEFPTIQAALDVAAPGDTVLVAPGVYQDTVSRNTPIDATFCAAIPAGVVLKSEAGPESTTIHLPATGASRSWAVIAFGSMSVPRELNGFTVTADSGTTAGALVRLGHLIIKECRFEGIVGRPDDWLYSFGGALHVDGSIQAYDSEFVDCRADYGGGICFKETDVAPRTQILERCEFTRCGGFASYHSNEQSLLNVQVRYQNCVFASNAGGGLYMFNARDTRIRECTFRENACAAELRYCRQADVQDCLFVENMAGESGVGGLFIQDDQHPPEFEVSVLRNVFLGNSGYCAALSWGGSGGVLQENIFYGCQGEESIVGIFPDYGPSEWVEMSRNIFIQNSALTLIETNGIKAGCNISWNNEGYEMPGMHQVDPLFCDAENGDFRVAQGSPCQDPNVAGSCGQIGPFGVGCPSRGTAAVTLLTIPSGLLVSADGQEKPSPGIFVFPTGEMHEVGVAPIQPGSAGSRFVYESWDDGGSNPHSIHIPESSTARVATFGDEHFLSMVPEAGGTTVPLSGWYAEGASVPILAVPYETSEFSHWHGVGSGSYSGTADSAVVTMLNPIIQYASFTQNEFPVTIHSVPGGTVFPESGMFLGGTEVTIEARPDGAHTFAGWIGNGSGSYTGPNSVATVTVLGPIEQTPSFSPIYAGYDFTISASDVDPHQTTSAPANGWRPLYFWATCLGRGLAAFEAEVSSELNISSFQPMNGVLNAGSERHLLLAIPNCPVGTDANVLLGYWSVNDTGGSVCLIPSSETGNLAAVDCDIPNPFLWPDPQVEGFSSAGDGPCLTGSNGCVPPGGDPNPPGEPTTTPLSSSWNTSFPPPRPNPFARTVDLSFALANGAEVRLELFDVQGRRVRRLCESHYGPGAHSISWDGRADTGLTVPSGIFFARFSAGDFVQVRKLVRLEDR